MRKRPDPLDFSDDADRFWAHEAEEEQKYINETANRIAEERECVGCVQPNKDGKQE